MYSGARLECVRSWAGPGAPCRDAVGAGSGERMQFDALDERMILRNA